MKLTLPQNRKYLAGVSGGCDSMALLSLCVENGLDVVVAFVNYKLRKTSDLEEQIVRDYCNAHNIPFHALYPVQAKKENFQKWARDARYEFYGDIYREHGCDALLLGHQKDDNVENYLMALARKSRGMFYGIQKESFHHGMHIIRPLLDYRKSELRKYCDENAVPYHDDESNFTDKYQRNRIRHSLVETASDEQIDEWVKEINRLNAETAEQLERYQQKYGNSEMISLADFASEDDQKALLRWFIYRYDNEYNYPEKRLEDALKAIKTAVKGSKDLHNGSTLVWEYGVMYVCPDQEKYRYVIDRIEYLETPYFSLKPQGRKIEGMTVTDDDFPLVIRPYENDDSIELRYGHKKVRRFMIDRKIYRKNRQIWPVVENREGRIIFVYGIGCTVSHYSANPNLFMIK